MRSRLLIVDDEASIRNALVRHFRLRGYEADSAENGREALKKMAEKPYSVVISDILMPEMNGIDLLRHIKKEYPMTRTIMITGYVTLENGLACMRNGADTLIFKPFSDLFELDSSVEAAIDYLKHWESKLLFLRGLRTGGEI